MTETLPHQAKLEISADHELSSKALFADRVNRMEQAGVEIPNKEALLSAGESLIDGHELGTEFFEHTVKSQMFISVAHKLSEAPEDDTSTKEHAYDIVTLMAGEDSAFADIYRESQPEFARLSGDKLLGIFDRFTNQEVTKDLTDRILKDGLFDAPRKGMGITVETEDSFEIRVLNITPGFNDVDLSYQRKHGLVEGEWTPEQSEKDEADNADFAQYRKKLGEKSEEFKRLTKLDSIPGAWVMGVNKKPIICIPLPLAERLAYPDESYRPNIPELEREDKAVLQHEYAHTQSRLYPGTTHLGIGLEELKAEHYSGNRLGYVATKKHFQMVGLVGDYSIKDIFNEFGEDCPLTPQSFYEELGRRGGLDAIYDAVVSIPKEYAKQTSLISKLELDIDGYVGGSDGVQEKAWERAVEAQGEKVVIQRLKSHSEGLMRYLKSAELMGLTPESLDFYLDYDGPTLISNKMKEILNRNNRNKLSLRGNR